MRHVAHPRRMKYISGLHNAQICSVNDVGYIRHDLDKAGQDKLDFPPNNFNESLLKSESFTVGSKKERVVPPNGMWQTFGIIDDTEKWRQQLNSLASSVGLLTKSDIENYQRKKERNEMMKNLQKNSQARPSTTANAGMCTPLRKPGSSATRYNEPLLTGRKKSRAGSKRFSRGASSGRLTGNKHFIVDQSDRETWMLQVLCQILQTDNLADVQAWLVSTNDTEKERVKQLIDHAMKGLEQSGRIIEQNQAPADKCETPKTGTVVIPGETKQPNASSLDYIENALQKMDVKQSRPYTTKETTKLPNILKLDDDNDISN